MAWQRAGPDIVYPVFDIKYDHDDDDDDIKIPQLNPEKHK